METLNKLKSTSFNQLIRVIKGIVKKRDATRRIQENGEILSKIRELIPSISYLMKEHPYHIPVILYHLSSVTSKLKLPYHKECVTRIDRKLGENANISCKICNGVCKELYVDLVDIIRDNMVYLSPKGLSQVMSIYSDCKNEKIGGILAEIKLRMCYFIYCRCKNMNRISDSDDVESIIDEHESVFREYSKMRLKNGDYLVDFVKIRSVGTEKVVKNSIYYLPVNLMDICITLDSILSNHDSNTSNSNTNDTTNTATNSTSNPTIINSNTTTTINNMLNSLMLKLSFRLLLYNSFTRVDSVNQFKFSNKFELDSVCRLIGIFKRCKYNGNDDVNGYELILSMIVQILNENIEELDFRNLVTLLDSFSKFNELQYEQVYVNDNRNCVNYDNMVSDQYNKVNIGTIIDRIEVLCSHDSVDYIRSLATIAQVMKRIDRIIGISEYERFEDIVKRALIKYFTRHSYVIKDKREISSIAILIKNIQHPEVIRLVSELILKELISFESKNLYDYSIIIDVLSRNYQKYAKYKVNNVSNPSNCGMNKHQDNIDDVYNRNDRLYPMDNNHVDMCKLYSSLCLMVSKCSYYYRKILEESLKLMNMNLNNIPLKEMSFFLMNVERFNSLQVVENEYLKECNINIANLTERLEYFFTKYHTRLCEMDHNQISKYLSQT